MGAKRDKRDKRDRSLAAAQAASGVLNRVLAVCREDISGDAALGIQLSSLRDDFIQLRMNEKALLRIRLPRYLAERLLQQRENADNPHLTETARKFLAAVRPCEVEDDVTWQSIDIDYSPLVWAIIEFSNACTFGWPAWLTFDGKRAVVAEGVKTNHAVGTA